MRREGVLDRHAHKDDFGKVKVHKPTNASSFSGRCVRPRWAICHYHPVSKSKAKSKSRNKKFGHFNDWVVQAGPSSKRFANLLSLSDINHDDDLDGLDETHADALWNDTGDVDLFHDKDFIMVQEAILADLAYTRSSAFKVSAKTPPATDYTDFLKLQDAIHEDLACTDVSLCEVSTETVPTTVVKGFVDYKEAILANFALTDVSSQEVLAEAFPATDGDNVDWDHKMFLDMINNVVGDNCDHDAYEEDDFSSTADVNVKSNENAYKDEDFASPVDASAIVGDNGENSASTIEDSASPVDVQGVDSTVIASKALSDCESTKSSANDDWYHVDPSEYVEDDWYFC